MKPTSLNWILIVIAAVVFSGCATTAKDDEASAGAQVEDRTGADTGAATQGAGFTGSPLDDPNSPLYSKTIYFDFDRSEIRGEYIDMLRAHADYLINDGNAIVTIEGHCDERGSREYNIALGERRANAISSFLQAEGVPAAQIGVISYGEERPADSGHDENAWAQNRRGELVY